MKTTIVITLLSLITGFLTAEGQAAITHLQLEYQTKPLGIDIEKPRFSWQMKAPSGERGYGQATYRILVTDKKENIV